jgi:tRNA(Phe) wybutosine-synthesizing methylase Tyw3
MDLLLAKILSLQATSSPEREGLPFWIFWLLISVILLLVAFIFLRDKDLRQRLSYFLFGAKRRMMRLRLQVRLRRENGRVKAVLRELGKKAWGLGLEPPRSEGLLVDIRSLEDQKSLLQQDGEVLGTQLQSLVKAKEEYERDFRSRLQGLEARRRPQEERLKELAQRIPSLPSVREELEKEKAGLQSEIEDVTRTIREQKANGREAIRRFDKDIAKLDGEKQKLGVKIRTTERQTQPLFETLGRQLEESKTEHPELAVFCSQIARSRKTIQDLQNEMERLHLTRA